MRAQLPTSCSERQIGTAYVPSNSAPASQDAFLTLPVVGNPFAGPKHPSCAVENPCAPPLRVNPPSDRLYSVWMPAIIPAMGITTDFSAMRHAARTAFVASPPHAWSSAILHWSFIGHCRLGLGHSHPCLSAIPCRTNNLTTLPAIPDLNPALTASYRLRGLPSKTLSSLPPSQSSYRKLGIRLSPRSDLSAGLPNSPFPLHSSPSFRLARIATRQQQSRAGFGRPLNALLRKRASFVFW